jgi:sugar O-acyltransferase (sialic acid O-acetyltransferase NeuD family)
MNDKVSILIIGCGGHSRFILDLVAKSNFEAFGLINLAETFDTSEVIMGVPVIGCLSSIRDLYKSGHRNIAMGIGDNFKREEIFFELKKIGFNFPNLCHPVTSIDPSSIIGEGNVIGPNVALGAEVVIGDNNIINTGAVIEHQSIIGSHNHLSVSATICGNVKIGDKVFAGANSTIIDKISVSDKTTLGAGSTLISSTDRPGLTLVGCPAKVTNK